jgi:integrase
MRRTKKTDLSKIDISTIAPPPAGEVMLRDSVAKGLALRLRASGARTWIMLSREGAKTIRRTLGDANLIPLSAARRMATDLAAPSNAPASGDREDHPFGEDVRIADLLPHFLASGKNGRWKSGTLKNMKALGDVHIIPRLGRRKVRDLTPEEVTRWHLDVTAQSTAARMALSTLSGLMLYAEDHGLRPIGTNPCRGLRKKQRGHRGKLLPAPIVKRLWTTLDRLQTEWPDACDAVRLLMLTGARRSEILSLEWDRIVGSRAVLEDSKAGPRTIWLNGPARAVLEARRAAATGRYVFPAAKRDGPIQVIDRAWFVIRQGADLGPLRLHDLRHHFASVAVSNGIDLRVVGQLLGHYDLDSTLGYAHLATDALVKSATRVSGYIDRSLRGQAAAKPARGSRTRKPSIGTAAVSMEARHA